MPARIRETSIADDHVEGDADDPEVATLWIQVTVSLQVNLDLSLAVLQAIALYDARDEISAQIQEITHTHGPVP